MLIIPNLRIIQIVETSNCDCSSDDSVNTPPEIREEANNYLLTLIIKFKI